MEMAYRIEYLKEKERVEVKVVDLARMTWDALGARQARRDGGRLREATW